jgi:aspartyl-tRNA(Asn)/glutamyl-tRNA(Gln) amidotransferase subunit B
VIGLEVHCQLATRTKLFCAARTPSARRPTRWSARCASARPGALPVLERAAVRLALRAGLALAAPIDRTSRFDRKNYFYCDLPEGLPDHAVRAADRAAAA